MPSHPRRQSPSRALFLSAAVGFSGCGRIDYEAVAPESGRSFGAPEPVTELNSGTHTHGPSLTGDLLEIFFESTRSGSDDLWHATRASPDEPFTTIEQLAALSSAGSETGPDVSADGLRIWFSSNRAPSLGSFDIWTSTRASRDAPWDPPEHAPELSSPLADYSAAPTADALSIVVQGGSDLFIAHRPRLDAPWSALEPVLGVNTADSLESNAHLAPDRRTIYFSSNRPGTMGGRDIYRAVRASDTDPFEPPTPLAEVNTSAFEDDPWVSPDGTYLVFARDSGTRELYESRLE